MRIFQSVIYSLALFFFATSANANPLSDSWQCAKKAGMSSVSIGADLYKKSEALVSKAGPMAICLGKTGPEAQALMVTSSALTAIRLAKPSLLPAGQCESRIKGLATKPFANGLAAILPASGAKNSLISAAKSDVANDQVWNQIGQLPPPFSSVPNQVECGCLMSDAGLSLTDVSAVTNAISDTSASCATALNSLGLGFINDIGSYAIKLGMTVINGLSDKWDEWKGQSDPGSPDLIYKYYFGDHMQDLAYALAVKPGDWTNPKFNHDTASCASSGQYQYCQLSVPELRNKCAAYYDDHKMSAGNADKVCDGYQTAMVGAATILSKKYIAYAALPPMIDQQMRIWMKNEWMWRLPKFYRYFVDSYDNGTVTDYTINPSYNPYFHTDQYISIWGDVLGKSGVKKNQPAWIYDATGLYALARNLVVELGNDPESALDLAFAATAEPLRDKLRKIWVENRLDYASYQLRSWYPKPVFGDRYGCNGSGALRKTCIATMEDKFDKSCFAPLSEMYLTIENALVLLTKGKQAEKKCRAQLDPILAATKKMQDAEAATINAACASIDDRNEHGTCLIKNAASYQDCAAKALKQGKDDAGNCFQGRQLGKSIMDQLKNGMKQPKPTTSIPPAQEPIPPAIEPQSRKP